MTTIDEGVVRPTAPPAPQGRARSQVEQALAAIARTDAVVNAFTEVLPERARHRMALPCMSRSSSSITSPTAKTSGSVTTARPR